MEYWFQLLLSFFNGIIGMLRNLTFDGFGVETNYFDVIFAAIVVMMVIGLFWKGARG